MLQAYRQHAAERAALGIPPLPLDAKQTAELIELIKGAPAGQVTEESAFLLDLLTHRVPPGVDDAAKVKASFLAAVAHGDLKVGLVSKAKATELLGTMVGGYNVHPLIELLDDAEVALVTLGSMTGAGKDAVDEARDRGQRVGLVKVKTYRPFPVQAIAAALNGLKAVGVVDRSVSFGWNSGPLFQDVIGALQFAPQRPAAMSFIGGLAGALPPAPLAGMPRRRRRPR